MVRNFGLDLLRAISIWLVLLQHGGINIPGLEPLKIGGIGVEIFFVISGFLIGGILFKEIQKGHGFFKTLQAFWIRRWFRILPLYYLVLCFKFIFLDQSVGWNILYYVFFLQNNFYGISYLGVSWSLVIEEWFYLFSPIFLWVMNKVLKSEQLIFISMLAFILFVNILRFLYAWHGNVPYEGVNSNFPFRFDSLFLGVALSYMHFKKWKWYDRLSSPKWLLFGLSLFISYLIYFWNLSFHFHAINSTLLPRTLGFFILPLSIALIIPFMYQITINTNRSLAHRLFFSFINITSILTYSIYLIHTFVFELKFHLVWSILLTYMLSWLIYTFFEKPILKYRDRLTK
jgi:peptidoglycan/LPS O-acetylase OafA/YrhL